MPRSSIFVAGLWIAMLAAAPALARATHSAPENCSAVYFDVAKKTVTLTTVPVRSEVEKPGPFTLPANVPADTRNIMCVRPTLIPDASDLKVILAGFTLTIAVDGGATKRAGLLNIAERRVRYRMGSGVLSAEEAAELKERLAWLQDQVDRNVVWAPGSN